MCNISVYLIHNTVDIREEFSARFEIFIIFLSITVLV